MVNIWTERSIELANNGDYLDLLSEVYPMATNTPRELSKESEELITKYYNERNSNKLIKVLLKQPVFPIKDSYVSYIRRDQHAIDRNPETIERLANIVYNMDLEKVLANCVKPAETNRQIGPSFYNWINNGSLGVPVTDSEEVFFRSNENIVFNSSDGKMAELATNYLGYQHAKGLDFIAKFNNKIILAEAKFLSDFGGHQTAQFNDAISVLRAPLKETEYQVKTIAILDGVLYIPTRNKVHLAITDNGYDDEVILSALLLKDYLNSL